MKKRLSKLVFFCLFLSVLSLCNLSFVSAKSKKTLKLSKTSITLQVKQSKKLSVKNTKKKIKWISSNKQIVTVNKSGKITGKKIGKATITAKVGKKKLNCRVTVKKKPYHYKHHPRKYYINRRNQIYKELGINNSMKPQYICFLLAKWECDHVTYSQRDSDLIFKKKYNLSTADLGQTYQQALDLGTAVCGGYSHLYKFLLDGLNIECTYHENSIHAWNYVKIDGKWYGVDVTFIDQDESVPECGESIRYDFASFLVPDKYMGFWTEDEDKLVATDYRFFNTIYEECLNYANAHPEDDPNNYLSHWDKNKKFHGKLADYQGPDYRYNPWFTGSWVNY